MSNTQLEAKLTTPGSTLYCAVQRLPGSHRIPCLGLFYLHDDLRELVLNQSETAYVKYGWWHEECARLVAGQPRHPATQAISMWQYYAQCGIADWLRNLESSMGISVFNDETELLDLCSTLTRPLFKAYSILMSDLYGDSNRCLKDNEIDQVSLVYTLFHFIQNFGQYLRRGIIPVPRSELEDQITAGDLLTKGSNPAFQRAMQVQYKRLSKLYSDLFSQPSVYSMQKQPVISTILLVHQAILNEIKRSNHNPIDDHIDITPLRKTWIAWNAHRRAGTNA